MIIDASNLIVGRLATVAAKKALLGEDINIVNCENSYVSGEKFFVIEYFKSKRAQGSIRKGPFFPRMPDRIVKRVIRGMLPRKKPRGREALGRVKCYIGVPAEFGGKKFETVKNADISKLPSLRYVQLKRICKELGVQL
ncbi:MAG TPA: 50S ribosomal protein L13 [Candidatus Nanoarchaeia archaeon]|nr:50S ribosomal protein L13 [Candidatus Nanoarchaeia archaeon]